MPDKSWLFSQNTLIILVNCQIGKDRKRCLRSSLSRYDNSNITLVGAPKLLCTQLQYSNRLLLLTGKLIGRAAAHEIFLGSVRARSTENCEVAVKMLPKYASNAAKSEFMNEIERMKSIGFNDHIVNMIGCISVGSPICLVLEYCSNSDLLHYLREKRNQIDELC